MESRRAFRSGHTVVVALPRKYREALKILPGTQLCFTLKDRAIHIAKAQIVPENMLGPGADLSAAATGSEE